MARDEPANWCRGPEVRTTIAASPANLHRRERMSGRMSVLEDKDAIREVMAAYCHALDAGRFADVASLFAEDGIWTTDYGEAKGRDAIEQMLRRIVPVKGEGPQRKHYITNIIIKVNEDGADSISDYL